MGGCPCSTCAFLGVFIDRCTEQEAYCQSITDAAMYEGIFTFCFVTVIHHVHVKFSPLEQRRLLLPNSKSYSL